MYSCISTKHEYLWSWNLHWYTADNSGQAGTVIVYDQLNNILIMGITNMASSQMLTTYHPAYVWNSQLVTWSIQVNDILSHQEPMD